MNKRQVISSLNNIAEELDNNGLNLEAKSITNVMKKLAQMDQGSGDLLNKVQISMGEVDNLLNIFIDLSTKYEQINNSLANVELTSARNEINRVLSNLLMQPNRYNQNFIISNYKPSSLVELRDYISRFYKKEFQNYSSNNSLKIYLSFLGKFTNLAVSDLNNIAMDKTVPKKPNQE